ncbi:cellulase family glycosylhydrolase [Streptacidiphilus anmyonensis]|uniref:cellulase family glycosylhydrolase n=1 Tax=Streptacidiphilus anmyonensis TaxID=405782 RepID=UPI000A51337C|nr:cellulase family glycosylhydrolase [Streptacidiphilus anmyonensis]
MRPRAMHPRARLAAVAAALGGFTAALVPLTATAATSAPAGTTAGASATCSVAYTVSNDWGTGFTAAITITDTGATPLASWTLGYAYGGNQTLQSGWNGTWSQSGSAVTVTAPSWATTIAPGASYTTDANFGYSGTNTAPTAFTVNGVACGDSTSPSASPSASASASPSASPSSSPTGTPGAAPALHVSGNHLVDANGHTVTLHGVDRSGTEFACVQNTGVFDGPADQASVSAMTSWRINAVRVPLNEDCWLGANGVNPAYAGANYIAAVKAYVSLLEQNGLNVILDLHWTDGAYTGNSSGCSGATAVCQKPMPDAAGAVPFWTSVATTFKGDDAVVFDLFNEPYPDRATGSETSAWECWLNGGTCPGIGYTVAGMQSLDNAVRGTGATNVVMLGGLAYSNDLTQWLAYEPHDPTGNVAASWHSYNFNACSSSSCWNAQIAPVAAKVPLVTGELGENDCAHGYLDSVLPWLDSIGASYLAWTWNTWDCASGPALISSYDGTPTGFGAGYKAHLATLG